MTRLRNVTFEDGTLLGDNGADEAVSAVAIENVTPIKGLYSAISGFTRGFVGVTFTVIPTVYISFYIKIISVVTTPITVLRLYKAGEAGVLSLFVETSSIQLNDDLIGTVGDPFTFTVDTIYRIGIRYTIGTGTDAIMQLYIAEGDTSFSNPIVDISNSPAINTVDTLSVGINNLRTGFIVFDNIRIDTESMPTDDVALSLVELQPFNRNTDSINIDTHSESISLDVGQNESISL